MKLVITNMNNSLVFYRNLFNKMPVEFDFQRAVFQLNSIDLELVEEGILQPISAEKTYLFKVDSRENLAELLGRMKRFFRFIGGATECKSLDNQFEVPDPDGHKWLVYFGEPALGRTAPDQCFFVANT